MNSVNEALFSQDGWGGSNVRQGSAWNIENTSEPISKDINNLTQSTKPTEPAGTNLTHPWCGSNVKQNSIWSTGETSESTNKSLINVPIPITKPIAPIATRPTSGWGESQITQESTWNTAETSNPINLDAKNIPISIIKPIATIATHPVKYNQTSETDESNIKEDTSNLINQTLENISTSVIKPISTTASGWGDSSIKEDSKLGIEDATSPIHQGLKEVPGTKTIAPSPPPNLTQAQAPTEPTKATFAAAAGKGLPVTINDVEGVQTNKQTNKDQTRTTSNTSNSIGLNSKYFEKLNSVREALLSPNGWGGSNVKQDSVWNVESIQNATNQRKSNTGKKFLNIAQ